MSKESETKFDSILMRGNLYETNLMIQIIYEQKLLIQSQYI